MARNYHKLLPYTFKRFSILTALKTGLPTLTHYLRRTPLPKNDKPALFTMNILPPMMTVWYHFVRKNLGDRVDITIFDCSGKLKSSEFPHARVQKFLNFYAATKSDEFLKHIARNRKIGWICDDDMFLMSPEAVDRVKQELSVPNTASVSFRPRDWWHFEIDGKQYEPSSSYCIAFNREILIEKEKMGLRRKWAYAGAILWVLLNFYSLNRPIHQRTSFLLELLALIGIMKGIEGKVWWGDCRRGADGIACSSVLLELDVCVGMGGTTFLD